MGGTGEDSELCSERGLTRRWGLRRRILGTRSRHCHHDPETSNNQACDHDVCQREAGSDESPCDAGEKNCQSKHIESKRHGKLRSMDRSHRPTLRNHTVAPGGGLSKEGWNSRRLGPTAAHWANGLTTVRRHLLGHSHARTSIRLWNACPRSAE